MLKKDETADTIYITFIKSKPEEEKIKVLQLLKEAAKISNNEKDVRSKALALLGYFHHMSYSENKFYSDFKSMGEIIKRDTEIMKIINGNIEELNIIIKKGNYDLMKDNDETNNLIINVMLIIKEFKLKNDNSKKFFELLKSSLSLEEKYKNNTMNQMDLYIVEQLQRMKLMRK